jgi:hypothetical protein
VANIKYAEGLNPKIGKSGGFVFYASDKGNTLAIQPIKKKANYIPRIDRRQNLTKASKAWKGMDPGVKSNWNTFAATYPQPCENPDRGNISGYELFVKRNDYLFLNFGLGYPFMTAPLAPILIPDPIYFLPSSSSFQIDITDIYLLNFGKLPELFDTLYMQIISYDSNSGWFFPIMFDEEPLFDYDGSTLGLTAANSTIPQRITYSIFCARPEYYLNPTLKPDYRYMGSISTQP